MFAQFLYTGIMRIIYISVKLFSVVDPGFLEKGFICIKVWGFALLVFSHFSKISHKNEIIWSF